jgi:hypothetical protein
MVSIDELSVIEVEFELLDASGIDVLAFLSRNRRLFGGNESISVVGFVCLMFVVELLVLLPSPAPVLEHELTSSFGLVAGFDSFSTKGKSQFICFFC